MIFGHLHSKFVVGANTVKLPHSRLEPDWQVPREIMHQSILTGHREWVRAHDYSEFEVNVLLTKESDPNAKLSEIMTYRNSICVFYPHKDLHPVASTSGSPAEFVLTVTPYYIANTNELDGCIVTFRSLLLTEFIANYLVFEDGEKISKEDESGWFVVE